MSLEEWRHGLHTGLQQEFEPKARQQNKAWLTACKSIIEHCVAPSMRPMAMQMLHEAMIAAERTAGDIPKSEIEIPTLCK
jgi:hypothetical protein